MFARSLVEVLVGGEHEVEFLRGVYGRDDIFEAKSRKSSRRMLFLFWRSIPGLVEALCDLAFGLRSTLNHLH
jgi:hypothetical protein